MNETAQIVIVGVVTVLTVVLTLVGIQILFVLQELKKTLSNANNIVGEIRGLTTKITHSTESVSGMLTGIKTGISLLGALTKKKDEPV